MAVVVLGVITAYFQDGDPVVSLSVEQPDLLREAVAGGAPWLLHCTTNATLPSAFLLTTNTAKVLAVLFVCPRTAVGLYAILRH